MRTVVIAMCFFVTFVPTLAAQDDAAEVLAVVERLFDGMRERDTTLLGQLFDPSARLVATGTRDGTPYARAIPVSDFIAAVGRGEGDPWIERIYHPKVQVSDHLASVWTWYTFHVGERLSHCGVDSFQLARGADGWKIVALADTRRTEGCEEIPTPDPDR
jgi:hypothetical protein